MGTEMACKRLRDGQGAAYTPWKAPKKGGVEEQEQK